MIKKFNMLFENNEETTKDVGNERVPEKKVVKEEPKQEEPKQDAEKETIIEESIKKYEDFLIEGEGGGGGVAYATNGNTAGMGNVTAPQPSSVPGDVAGSTRGSGDLPAYDFGKSFDHNDDENPRLPRGKKKKKKKSKKLNMKNYSNFTQYKLYEYLQQEEQWLFKYFNMSDDEKYINNAWLNQYRIKDFINTHDLYEYFNEEEIEGFDFDTEDINNNEDEDIFYEFEDYEKNEKKKNFLIDFGEWCYENGEYYDQAANLMFDNPRIFKKDWIVYKNDTSKIVKIYKDGFENGIDDYDQIYNYFYNDQNNQYGDIHIGRPIDDISSFDFKIDKNEDILMFKSSGVRLSDYSNNFDVVAFYGKAVYDLIWIEYGLTQANHYYEVYFIESTITGERLVEKEELEEIIEWIEKNYDQYRKHFQTDKYEILQKKKAERKKKKNIKKFKI